jgi:hypothetical protein
MINEKESIQEFIKKTKNGMSSYYEKKDNIEQDVFYKEVNKKTNDHIDIKAYAGNKIWKEVLILEGLASCNSSGITNKNSKIKKEDFWVINNMEEDVLLFSKTNEIKPIRLPAGKLKFIKNNKNPDFKNLCIYKESNKKICFSVL